MKKPAPRRADKAALAFDDAIALAEYFVQVDPRPEARWKSMTFPFMDAHDVGIPTGVTQGSVVAYAQALLSEPWPGVRRAMLLAELIKKEAA